MIARQLESLDDASSPEQMQQLMQQIESRASQRPDNLAYVALLGRYYMGQQGYARAAQTYGTLAQGAPEDAQALTEEITAFQDGLRQASAIWALLEHHIRRCGIGYLADQTVTQSYPSGLLAPHPDPHISASRNANTRH